MILLLIIGLVSTALIYGFKSASVFQPIDQFIKSIVPIQYDRFYMLYPILWYVLFAIALMTILQHFRKAGFTIAILTMILQIGFLLFQNDRIKAEIRPLFRATNTYPSYREYFAEEQFENISNLIPNKKNEYKIASVGLEPAVALFNGFYTIDGYISDYPLSYKIEFRKIIAPLLEIDNNERLAFDNWGSRVRLHYTNELPSGEIALNLNFEQLRALDCEYIISFKKINLDRNENIILIDNIKADSKTYWDLWLYKVPAKGSN